MPMIRVEMFEGRKIDQKRELVKELTDAFLRSCGGTRESVAVVITESNSENWAIGGQLVVDKAPG